MQGEEIDDEIDPEGYDEDFGHDGYDGDVDLDELDEEELAALTILDMVEK